VVPVRVRAWVGIHVPGGPPRVEQGRVEFGARACGTEGEMAAAPMVKQI